MQNLAAILAHRATPVAVMYAATEDIRSEVRTALSGTRTAQSGTPFVEWVNSCCNHITYAYVAIRNHALRATKASDM